LSSFETILFDLEKDRGEKNNLAPQNPEIAARMRASIEDWAKRNAPRIRRPGGPDPADEGERSERRLQRKQEKNANRKQE
jgi:hypothetical protein